MGRITRDAFLVGMKYHNFSLPARGMVSSDAIRLTREPANPYDSNAIAVFISGAMAGHLDKKSTAIIAPIIDSGALWRVEQINCEKTYSSSIPLKIILEQEVQSISPPRLAHGKVAGVYRISIRGFPEIYVGQSRDMNERIRSHWRELAHSVHSNPVMRQLWKTMGGDEFEGGIIEAAPPGLNDHDLSLWLQSREEYWIEHYDRLVGVMNFDAPNVVLVGAERLETRNRRLAARETSRSMHEQRKSVEAELERINEHRSTIQQQLHEAKNCVRIASGVWGFLFATGEQKHRAKEMEKSVPNLTAKIEELDTHRERLFDTLQKLPNIARGGRARPC